MISKGINQSETGFEQKVGGFVTRDQLDDRLRLVETDNKLRTSEAHGQLLPRIVSVEQKIEAFSKDVQRVETGISAATKEMRDAKRWGIGLIFTVIIACIAICVTIVTKFAKLDLAVQRTLLPNQLPAHSRRPAA